MTTTVEIEDRSFFQPLVQTIRLALDLPVAIWLTDDQGESLRILAAEDLPDDYMREVTLNLDEPSVGSRVFKTGETIVVADIASDERWQYKAEAADLGLKSAIVVPLRVDQEMRGILDVYTYEDREFTALEKKLIEEFASKVITDAIPSARYFQKASTQADILKKIHQIGRRILSAEFSTKGLKAALTQIAKSARNALGADLVDIYQYLDVEDLEMRNRYVLPPVLAGQRRDPTIIKEEVYEDDVIVKVIKGCEPVYARDAQAQDLLTGPFTIPRPDRPESRFVLREGILSSAAIPLKTAGETVGVMFINYRTHQDFPAVQQEFIELFANQAAMAIYNARIYEQAQKRIGALEALHEVGQKLSSMEASEQGLTELLEEVVKQAKEILGADLVELYQYSPGRREATHVRVGERLTSAGPPIEKVQILPDDVVAKIIADPSPIFGLDAQSIPLLSEPFKSDRAGRPRDRFVLREQIASLAALPLSVDEEPLGVLFVNYRLPQQFTDEQQVLIQLFASQAANAIRNARLFQQREVLQEIARDITSVLDSDRLLQKTLERSLELLNCEFGSISVYDPKNQLLHFRYAVGKSSNKYVAMGEGLIGTAAQTRKTIRVADVSDDDRYIQHIGETKSELDVPMLVGERLVGVLNAESKQINAFSEEDQRLAEALAAQVAVAFHTAELYEKRANDVQAIQEIFSAIGSVPVNQMLEEVVTYAARLSPASYATIWLFEEQEKRLRFGAEYGREVSSERQKHRLSINEDSINGYVALTRETYLCNDVAGDDYYSPWYSNVRSELATPLIYQDRLLGTLNLESEEAAAFTDDHIRLVEALAGAAAVAIQNARLYSRLDALVEVSQTITSTLDLSTILDHILKESLEILGANHGTLRLLNRATAELELRAHRGEIGDLTRQPLRIGQGIVGWVAEHGKPQLVSDVSNDDRYIESLKGTCSEVAVPITIEGQANGGSRTIGVLNIEHPQSYAFDEHDMHLLEAIANQAAVAIRNARSYESMQAVNDVGQTLTSGIRLKEDKILELIYEQAQKLTGAQDMYIALYDDETNTIRFGLATEYGERVEYESREADMDERGKTEEVIFTKQPILHGTLEESRTWYGRPGHQEFIGRVQSSYLGVPMIAGAKVLGMIALYNWEHEDVYDEQDLQVFSSMASQAAIALDNATLYYDVVQRLEALNEIGQRLTSGIRLEEHQILELIYEQAEKLTDVQDMYIALYNDETNTIHFGLATEHRERVEYDSREAYMEQRGKTEEVIFTKKPILHRTLEESRAWYGRPGHQEFIGHVSSSWMGVPMIVGTKALGMIALYDWEQEYAYDERDLQTFSSMASQSAIALDNNRLLESERDQRRLTEALRESGAIVSSTLSLDDVLERILEQVERIVEGDTFNVMLLGENESEIARFHSRGYARLGVAAPSTTGLKSIDELPILRKMRKTGEPLVITDTSTYSDWQSLKGREWLRSYAGAPIRTNNMLVGFLNVNGTRPAQFGHSDGERLLTFANYAAIAIKNARLYEQAREEVIATKQLATLGIAIAALQHRINNTFNIIVPNVTRLRKRVDPEDETIVEILNIIERNARYTSDIIARIQEPLREVEMQEVDVNAVLNEVIDDIEEQWEPDIAVRRNLDNNIPLIQAPIGQVTEVFRNLCDNACRAMKGSGELVIATTLKDCRIYARVQDTGPGIPPRKQERLFQKPVPSKEPGGGAGLGLWLSQLILQTIGGRLEIEESDAGGTTMAVQIPAS